MDDRMGTPYHIPRVTPKRAYVIWAELLPLLISGSISAPANNNRMKKA